MTTNSSKSLSLNLNKEVLVKYNQEVQKQEQFCYKPYRTLKNY